MAVIVFIYVDLIEKGLKTIEDVPDIFRENVREILSEKQKIFDKNFENL